MSNLLAAFRTTESGGEKFTMTFQFRTMTAMHEADDEWRALRIMLAAMPREGMVLVPCEPSEAMLKAVGWPFMGYMFPTQVDSAVRRMWSAMLDAHAKGGE